MATPQPQTHVIYVKFQIKNNNNCTVSVPLRTLVHRIQANNLMLDGAVVGSSDQVLAMPIAEILKAGTPIDFLKIDVEGLDLHALESTYPLFEKSLIRGAMVEFGPTCRWQRMAELAVEPGKTVRGAREHALEVMATCMHERGAHARPRGHARTHMHAHTRPCTTCIRTHTHPCTHPCTHTLDAYAQRMRKHIRNTRPRS